MTLRLLAVIALLALAPAACGTEEPAGAPADEPTDTGAPATTPADDAEATTPADDAEATEPADDAEATEPAGDATVATADTDLGEVLVDAGGMTLYLFDNDGGGESTCYDDCATNWPALTVDGEPTAGDGADAGLLGTTERDDGTTQVTYGGHPLYYFAGDSAAGDVAGQGVGGIWWVVDPAGEAVHDSEAASGSGRSDY